MITAAVRDALESTLIIKAEPTHIIFTVCSVFRLKCVSDLSKYCVRILVRGGFPISNYVVCVQSCNGSRGGYIIRFSHLKFVFCITGNQRMSLIHTLKVSDYQYVKSLTCGYSISVPDTFVMGYHTTPTHY